LENLLINVLNFEAFWCPEENFIEWEAWEQPSVLNSVGWVTGKTFGL